MSHFQQYIQPLILAGIITNLLSGCSREEPQPAQHDANPARNAFTLILLDDTPVRLPYSRPHRNLPKD